MLTVNWNVNSLRVFVILYGLVTCLYSMKLVKFVYLIRKPTYYNYFTRRRLHGTRPAKTKKKKKQETTEKRSYKINEQARRRYQCKLKLTDEYTMLYLAYCSAVS